MPRYQLRNLQLLTLLSSISWIINTIQANDQQEYYSATDNLKLTTAQTASYSGIATIMAISMFIAVIISSQRKKTP